MKNFTNFIPKKAFVVLAVLFCCFSFNSMAGLTLFRYCNIDSTTARFVLDYVDTNYSYTWDFGDGKADTIPQGVTMGDVQNIYDTLGSYYVCVTAWLGSKTFIEQNCLSYAIPDSVWPCCAGDISRVVVNSPKVVRFFPDYEGISDPVSFEWDFGDASPINKDDMPKHVYLQDSMIYNVSLTMVDQLQCTVNVYKPVFVYKFPAYCDGMADFELIRDERTGDVAFFDKSIHSTTVTGQFTDFLWLLRDSNGIIVSSSEERDPMVYNPPPGNFIGYHLAFDSTSMCAYDMNRVIKFDTLAPLNCFADFWFEPDTTDSTGLTWSFMNSSSANFNIVDDYWEFGDGMSMNTIDATHTFPGPGGYNVCLTITDSSGCMDQGCLFIEVGKYDCYAHFNFKEDSAGLDIVQFFDNSSKNITDYFWDFGDGTNSDNRFPAHKYDVFGFYEVCLTVYDSLTGCADYFCEYINVGNDSMSCFSHFSFWMDSVPNTVYLQFDGFGTDSTDGYWDLGDGNFAYDEFVVHQYSQAGIYKVCATIYDNYTGCQDIYCDFIQVGDPMLDKDACFTFADFSYLQDSGNAVEFYNNSNQFTQAYWEFGDGYSSASYDAWHIYDYPGYYDVCLTVYDDSSGCQRRFCDIIAVGDDSTACFLVAEFSFFPDSTGGVYFENYSLGDFTHSFWSLGDGFYIDTLAGYYPYQQPGIYEVCLTVYDDLTGCQDSYCDYVKAGSGDPTGCFNIAMFEFYPLGGGEVEMNNMSEGMISGIHWDFGDGNYSGQWSPIHQYTAPGYYDICLTIFNDTTGCQKTRCEFIKVGDDSGAIGCFIVADYDAFPDFSGGQSMVHFQNLSFGDITDVFWDFGDGTYSRDIDPTHVYADPGYYTVCLTVYDSITDCHATFCDAGEIIDPSGPMNYCHAFFTVFPDAANDYTGHFQNESQGAITDVYWDFSDGTYSNVWDPMHTFPGPGYYTVCLTVYDDSSGCQSTHCESGEILDPDSTYNNICDAYFTYYPDPTVDAIHFSNESKGSYTNVHWDFGDGTGHRNWDAMHQYPGPGYYEVCLTVYDSLSGCMSTFCDWVDLVDTAAGADCQASFEFYVDPSTNTVHLTDNSKGNATHYYWEFPDGRTYDTKDVTRQYPGPGYYPVCHAIYDSTTGCLDGICDIVALFDSNSTGCLAQFSYYPDNQANAVSFINESEGNFTKLYWQFGDGRVSNVWAPKHKYDQPGYYDVCLTVFNDVDSCISTQCDMIQIIDSTTTDCQAYFEYWVDSANKTLYITDKSFGDPIEWYYSFGDNSDAVTTQDPSLTYAEPGIYEVCVTITTANGCQRSFCKVIQVGDGGNDCFAEFTYYADSTTATAYFDNQSLGSDLNYTWEFGDDTTGFVSNQWSPAHTYPGVGVYPACLTVDNDSGCVNTICHYVNIGNDLADKCEFSCVWPGDANNDLEANHYDLIAICLNYGETGPERDSISNRWIGHHAQDWSTYQIDGVNNKHGDCDGDGEIAFDDIAAIRDNFAYSHPRQYNKTSAKSNPDLYFEITDGDVAPGSTVEVAIMMGKDTISLYGIGFEVRVDVNANLIDTVTVSYADSWLGTEGVDMLSFEAEDATNDEILISVSKTDHADATGMGEIASLSYEIDSSAIDGDIITICLSSQYGMYSNGDTVTVNAVACTTITVTGINDLPIEAKIRLYPNPTSGTVTLMLPNEINGEFDINIINTLGQNVATYSYTNNKRIELDLNRYRDGLYYIEIRSDDGVYQKPLYLIK